MIKEIIIRYLNEFLGDYFENVDNSQLSIPLWGDTVLANLMVKKTVIHDQSGIPIQIAFGQLGSLVLRIPWLSIYKLPVEVILKDLYIIVLPANDDLTIDLEKDKERKFKQKMHTVQSIEDSCKKSMLPPSPEQPDSMGEKLGIHIIRNLQVKIESIHIRFEDGAICPKPFAFGLLLKSLTMQTTNTEWTPAMIIEPQSTFYKIVAVEELGFYWNSDTELIYNGEDTVPVMIDKMRSLVEDQGVSYMLAPLNSEVKIQVTPSPEKLDEAFSLPKIILNHIMEELSLSMTLRQYHDIMPFIEELETMLRSRQYRVFRPPELTREVTGRDRAKLFWKFAIDCVLEEVRRKQSNWDWNHMKEYRKMVKSYEELLLKKLIRGKSSPEAEAKILEFERNLDAIDIVLARIEVDLKRERHEKRKTMPSPAPRAISSAGEKSLSTSAASTSTPETSDQPPAPPTTFEWLGGMISSSIGWLFSAREAIPSDHHLEMMASDSIKDWDESERKKLFEAIGYSHQSKIKYPEDYIDHQLEFSLGKFSLTLLRENLEVSHLQVDSFVIGLLSTPNPLGNKVALHMENIIVTGHCSLPREEDPIYGPKIIASQKKEGYEDFLQISYEVHSTMLLSKSLQSITLKSQPLVVIYNFKTIEELGRFFTLPTKSSAIQTRHRKHRSHSGKIFHYIKEKTFSRGNSDPDLALALKRVSNPKVEGLSNEIQVDIDLVAPSIVIPQDGIFLEGCAHLLIDFGALQMANEPRQMNPSKESLKLQYPYDVFNLILQGFKISLINGSPGRESPINLMEYGGCKVNLERLLQSPGMDEMIAFQCPKTKATITAPPLEIDIAEEDLVAFIQLLKSIKTPSFGDGAPKPRIPAIKIPRRRLEELDLVVDFQLEAIKARVNSATSARNSGTDVTSTDLGSRGESFNGPLKPIFEFDLRNFASKLTNSSYLEMSLDGLSFAVDLKSLSELSSK